MNILSRRENCWELIPKVPRYSYRAMRRLVHLVVESMEGKLGSRGNVEKRRNTLTGVGDACGECRTIGYLLELAPETGLFCC
jgi:hypothetical protein